MLEEAARHSGLDKKFLQSVDEKPIDSSLLYRSVGLLTNEYGSIASQALKAQREIIQKVAAEGPCVIVGRGADLVLAGSGQKLLRVFISAREEARARRVMERDGLDQAAALLKIEKADGERAAYYNQRSASPWGEAASYDLCLDTETFPPERAAALLAAIAAGEL